MTRTLLRALRKITADPSIEALKPKLAKAAQKVYDEWEQDAEGWDEELGTGGICQDIALAMGDVLIESNIECSSVSAAVGEQHVYLVAQTDEGVFEVDISPYTYESGGGYNWKKKPDVEIKPNDVTVTMLNPDPETFEQYLDE